MADTTHLILPLMAAAQAQKHVTHNDALLRLDALVHLSVIDRDLPASGATGAWEGADLNIVWFSDGVWTKLVPRKGWRAWVEDEEALLAFDGSDWAEIEGGGGGGPDAFFHVNKDGTNQTGIAQNTDTKLTWAQKVADADDTFDLGNDQWTPPAGPVLMWAVARWLSNNVTAGDQHLIRLYKNGNLPVDVAAVIVAASSNAFSMMGMAIDNANGTDTYEIRVRHDGSGTRNISGADVNTFWMGLRLGA